MPEAYQLQEARQQGNTDKCLRVKGQLEKVEETVVIASTSSHEVEVASSQVGCAVVATKAIVYST